MKKIILLPTMLLFSMMVFAQSPTPPPATPPPTPPPAKEKAAEVKNSGESKGSAIGLNLSTNGAGLQFAHNLNASKSLTLRVGGAYLPYSISNLEMDLSGTVLVFNGDIKLGAIQALVDVHPFKNAFKITGGLAYMLTDISISAIPRDSTKQSDIMLAPEELGKIEMGLKFGPICPYVGAGFGRAVPKNRVSFNFEVGAYYIGKQDVKFQATGMLEPTSSQEYVIKNNMAENKWLPMLNLGLNIKLGK